MPQFLNLHDNAHLSDLLVRFPRHVQRLMDYANAVLREDGALEVGDRELIAALLEYLVAAGIDSDVAAVVGLFAEIDGFPELAGSGGCRGGIRGWLA